MEPGYSTRTGYLNARGQVVIRNTMLDGTDHGQKVYQVACSHCGEVYGANGLDLHIRKCPNCQGGQPGLEYRT
jgi:Zn finger protein HypA/HybF involved in hydrogenase expression